MLSLNSRKWVRYVPPLDGNDSVPESERFCLELCAGLPTTEYLAMRESLSANIEGETDEQALERVAGALRPHVRLGKVAAIIDGKMVASIDDYLRPVMLQRGLPLFYNLVETLSIVNSWEGSKEVFYVRPSGGSVGTGSSATAAKAAQ